MSILQEIKYLKKLVEIYRNFIVDVMDFNADKLDELEERAKEVIDNERNN